jgi:hypothetical protein
MSVIRSKHNERARIVGVYCSRMRSPLTLGIVFIAMGGLSVSGIGGRHALGPVAWVIAGLLIAAGIALVSNRPFAFYLAIFAGAITAATGILPFVRHPELALPVPPLLSIVVGLYLVARTAMLRLVAADKQRGFLPHDDTHE